MSSQQLDGTVISVQFCSVRNASRQSLQRGGAVLTGVLVPVAVVCVAIAVVATVFLRRQWTRAETRRLQLTVKLSGLADDQEVFTITS